MITQIIIHASIFRIENPGQVKVPCPARGNRFVKISLLENSFLQIGSHCISDLGVGKPVHVQIIRTGIRTILPSPVPCVPPAVMNSAMNMMRPIA